MHSKVRKSPFFLFIYFKFKIRNQSSKAVLSACLCMCVCEDALSEVPLNPFFFLFQLKRNKTKTKPLTNIFPCGRSFGFCLMWTTKRLLVYGVPPTFSEQSVGLTETNTWGVGGQNKSALGMTVGETDSTPENHKSDLIRVRVEAPKQQDGSNLYQATFCWRDLN